MKFKTWFYDENMAGPGGGPEPTPEQQDKLAMNMHKHGAGAFLDYSTEELPPKQGNTPLRAYLPAHTGKSVSWMKKKMRKKMKK